ncbi:hypothetical protein FHX37_1989 [Haloactinospora alba]|uniref:Uncharacterized protein n=1 Tax=Haloactinospora alba TaxID=405555 RepID=A0A543NJU4_9ACTN|nr:hypothetical protein [Haloactinospora alba]TQN32064.1 hypothetical protein FHX37_1989 [Haloactinospora alba]
MTEHPSTTEWFVLSALFRKAADEGYGFFDGTRFEAIPGMENATADYIQSLLDEEGE